MSNAEYNEQQFKEEKEELLADVLLEINTEWNKRTGSTIHRRACDGISERVIALAHKHSLDYSRVFRLFTSKNKSRSHAAPV